VSAAADALVIGAGPSGAATAILLARAGWQVVLVEQDSYPRRKVCGECINAATLSVLDDLGIGAGVRIHAGPELRKIGWMSRSPTVVTDFPACTEGPYRYGRALSRQYLDSLLVARARALGVEVLQPARVRTIHGDPGAYVCDVHPGDAGGSAVGAPQRVRAAVIIDAHGSWQRGPDFASHGTHYKGRSHRPSDLFAFKAVFQNARLEPGLLPVISLPGGYGGMVVADQGETTLACCVRRDRLSACRARHRGLPAGEAVEMLLREDCRGVAESLDGAHRTGAWLTVGPLWTGEHAAATGAVFPVGNAAAESHPLIGEGISMALRSATLLAKELLRHPPANAAHHATAIQRKYAQTRQRNFSTRLRVAALYAHVAMRPWLAAPAQRISARWPGILTQAARLAGKAANDYAQISPGNHS